MILFLTLSIIFVLFVISYQDFKERKISWLTIPFIVILFLVYAFVESPSFKNYINDVGFNLLFIVIQLSILFIYFSIRVGKFINIINTKIGLGDILFFVALTFAFSPVNFILFYVGSLSIITIVFLFIKSLFKNVSSEIPLAGAMSVMLIVWYVISLFIQTLKPLNDFILGE